MPLENTEGIVFGIQHFSIHDGPGIRTSVFLKGCNLRCAWCHNPESLEMWPQLSYIAERCIGCGACAAACSWSLHHVSEKGHTIEKGCAGCGACVEACPAEALTLYGKRRSVQEVFAEVELDRRYYTAGDDGRCGGLTVTGGEPTMQPEFLKALLKKAKDAEISTVVETNGTASPALYRELMPLTDLFLLDYKMTDSTRHKKWTGQGNERILENLEVMNRAGQPVILRCPIIPGVNDDGEHLRAIAKLTRQYPVIEGCEVMPYHHFGVAKARRIGWETAMEFPVPEAETVENWKRQIREAGGNLL